LADTWRNQRAESRYEQPDGFGATDHRLTHATG
jgi:hypothetical protein